jgi:hypothetical protein
MKWRILLFIALLISATCFMDNDAGSSAKSICKRMLIVNKISRLI